MMARGEFEVRKRRVPILAKPCLGSRAVVDLYRGIDCPPLEAALWTELCLSAVNGRSSVDCQDKDVASGGSEAQVKTRPIELRPLELRATP